MELWQQNSALINARWPWLVAPLTAALAHCVRKFSICEGLDSTVLVDGLQLTSRHQRVAEAQFLLSAQPLGEVVTIYGSGLGELPRLLCQLPQVKQLDVALINPDIFAWLLQHIDESEWLSDGKVTLRLADERSPVPHALALSGELLLAQGDYAPLRDRLLLNRDTGWRSHHASDPLIQQRFADNQTLIRQDADAAQLALRHQGGECWVVATGPTLASQYARLAQRPHQVVLIAVDTAVAALLAHGISPDYVVTIDEAISELQLSTAAKLTCPLIYFPRLAPQVLQAWAGPRYCAYSTGALYDELAQQLPRARLFSAGSVLHTAVDLALWMGARKVVLWGADFSYPSGRSHAHWAADSEVGFVTANATHQVENGHGGLNATHLNMRGYLRDLEDYIAAHPQVEFINTSLEGAKIAGTKLWLEQ